MMFVSRWLSKFNEWLWFLQGFRIFVFQFLASFSRSKQEKGFNINMVSWKRKSFSIFFSLLERSKQTLYLWNIKFSTFIRVFFRIIYNVEWFLQSLIMSKREKMRNRNRFIIKFVSLILCQKLNFHFILYFNSVEFCFLLSYKMIYYV